MKQNKADNTIDKKKEMFENMYVPKAVGIMIWPTIIGQLIILLYNLTDTYFLGQIGNSYMVAGASLVLPIYNIELGIASLAGVGGGALISRLLGQNNNNKDEIEKVSSFSIYLGVGIALIFSALSFLFMNPMLTLLGAGDDVFSYAREYSLCVLVAGAVPTVLSNTMATIIRSLGYSGKAGIGVGLSGILNAGLDPLFIFVIFPNGGEILGVGLATVVANVIACIYFFVALMGIKKHSGIRLWAFRKLPTKEDLKSIFGVGIPASIGTLLFDFSSVFLNRLFAGYGDIALASAGIALKLERLPLNIGTGICQGMMPMVAYNYSSKNLERMQAIKKFSRRIGILCTLFCIGVFELFPATFIGYFTSDEETLQYGIEFLQIRCIATVFMFLSFFYIYLFNGLGQGKQAFILSTVRWLVFNIPIMYLLNSTFGLYGLLWAQFVSDLLTVIMSGIIYTKFEKKINDK